VKKRAHRLSVLWAVVAGGCVAHAGVLAAPPGVGAPPATAPQAPPQPGQAAPSPATWEYRTIDLEGGGTLKYALILPEGFDAGATYPVLVFFGLDAMDEGRTEVALRRFISPTAVSRGWIVVAPIGNPRRHFFSGAEADIPALLDALQREFKVEGGRFHVGGADNGGRAAFRVAIQNAARVCSLTVMPGVPPTPRDVEQLDALKDVRVTMYVAGRDIPFVLNSRSARNRMTQVGAQAELIEFPNEQKLMPSLTQAALFDRLDAARAGCGRGSSEHPAPATDPARPEHPEAAGVHRVLDDWHAAAAAADESRYFGHMAADAVFMGTDNWERWTKAEFQAWAKPRFDSGKAWTMTPRDRYVFVALDGATAWFDEFVDHPSMGECRGTGVLVREGGEWKVAQYNLSVPIPNEIVESVAGMVRQERARQAGSTPGGAAR